MLFNILQTEIDSMAAAAMESVAAEAGDVMAAAQAIPQQQTMSYSLIEMASKGGWLMLVLLALSIIALYIFGKKWWMIRQANKLGKNFMEDIRDYIHEGKIKSAITLCEKYDSPIARLVEKGISRIGRPLADIQTAVENTANVEVARLEKGLSFLATTSGGAPMIGFLGTVIGMIQAFFNMSQAGNNIDITLLSSGIYTAMVTTVGGLIVGIICYFLHNILVNRINKVVFELEVRANEFMDLLNEPAEKETATVEE